MDKKNLAIVRQSFTNAALGHKIQEVAADRKETCANIFKWAEIVATGAVLALLITQTQIAVNPVLNYLGASLTAVEILLIIIKQSLHPDQDVVAHRNAAAKYMILRDEYKSLISDIISQQPKANQITYRRDKLLREYQLIAQLSLPTTDEDYLKALKRMKITPDDQNIWSDTQIDHLLPKELRKK